MTVDTKPEQFDSNKQLSLERREIQTLYVQQTFNVSLACTEQLYSCPFWAAGFAYTYCRAAQNDFVHTSASYLQIAFRGAN